MQDAKNTINAILNQSGYTTEDLERITGRSFDWDAAVKSMAERIIGQIAWNEALNGREDFTGFPEWIQNASAEAEEMFTQFDFERTPDGDRDVLSWRETAILDAMSERDDGNRAGWFRLKETATA